jgi:cGMP-dependent protein kinase
VKVLGSGEVQEQSSINVFFFLIVDSDDLRTANIIADEREGVTCLVIDRETFNQLISSLDEIRTRYKDEGVERRR